MPDELAALQAKMTTLLNAIGQPGECRFCGQHIWWVFTKGTNADGTQKRMPVSQAFLPHFADCPRYRKD